MGVTRAFVLVKRLLPWGVLELSEMSGSGLRREGKGCWFQCNRTSGAGSSLDYHVSQLPVILKPGHPKSPKSHQFAHQPVLVPSTWHGVRAWV